MIHAPGEVFEALVRAHGSRWTHQDELLALLVEKVDELAILFVQAWSDPKRKPRPRTPYRYPRPQLEHKKRRGSTPDQIRRFFRGK